MTKVMIVTDAVLEIDNAPIPLTAHISYDSADPVAVTFTFILEVELWSGRVAHDQQSWSVARDLLDNALSRPDEPVGEGDARFTYLPEHNLLRLELLDDKEIPRGVVIDADSLPEFMLETFKLAPAGREAVDVDSAIDALLRLDGGESA